MGVQRRKQKYVVDFEMHAPFVLTIPFVFKNITKALVFFLFCVYCLNVEFSISLILTFRDMTKPKDENAEAVKKTG